ncbi:hypothetical protein BUL40_08355 [Croceivirga radicis]|uniref:GtrA/DPMS transmembrane domain-containing protein n=1 Tax=Croceivirga radicis TaxID=1929488 RepID=A0A1V6LSC8_9FLAO|nr:GtrA family protein [Croceivirga radicis]OQD43091.1 hypothetical protein BUL40_08355 [Croceivirga radicis]
MLKINVFKTTFFKFLIVGGTGAVINLVVYAVLINFDVHYLLASLTSFMIAVTSNYYFNSKWTFKNRAQHKSYFKKYYEFVGISSLNLLTNLLFLTITLWYLENNSSIANMLVTNLKEYLNKEPDFYNKIIAQIVGIGFATVLNYLGNKFITFKNENREHYINS